jgi:hypothetical protein
VDKHAPELAGAVLRAEMRLKGAATQAKAQSWRPDETLRAELPEGQH